jgi:hypothetical protein
MQASEFTAFVSYIKEEFGAWEYQLAKAMGVTRQSIAKWQKTGCPKYIDLVASAVIAGLDPWKPEREHLPNPALQSPGSKLQPEAYTEDVAA